MAEDMRNDNETIYVPYDSPQQGGSYFRVSKVAFKEAIEVMDRHQREDDIREKIELIERGAGANSPETYKFLDAKVVFDPDLEIPSLTISSRTPETKARLLELLGLAQGLANQYKKVNSKNSAAY